MEITIEGLAEIRARELSLYPFGHAYDNLFNAEHRDIMIEKYGKTSASWTKIEDLLDL